MRLLLVIPNIVSYRSFLRELCRALVADGVEVHLACSLASLWGGRKEEEDGLRCHDVAFARGMNPLAHWRAARALDRVVEEVRPDLVHVHFSAAIFTTALARTARWPQTIATFHGVSFLAMQGWKALLLRVMEAWAARRLDAVWVLSDDDREGLRAVARGASVHRLAGFGVGCDLARFAPVSASGRAALRSQLGIVPGQVVFAFVGRFVAFKGFDVVVRAFLQCAAANPAVCLVLIGAPDDLHPTGLTPAEELALQASAQIIDAGYRPDVEHVLAAADAFVFPSRREGMPVCLMEALALGVPAITCDTRGCREVVRDGIDGLVLRDQSVPSFAAAMERVAGDAGLRRRWAAQALEDRSRFSRDRFITEQNHIYEACLRAVHAVRPAA